MFLQSKESKYIHKVSVMGTENEIIVYSYTDGNFYSYKTLKELNMHWKDCGIIK